MRHRSGRGSTGHPNGVIYTAAGAQGHWIFVVPKHDVAIAVTSNTLQEDAPVQFLYEYVLPAVR